jgi:hypothetical protein
MLLLTDKPITQLFLLIFVNVLSIILCASAIYTDTMFRWAGLYFIAESCTMLIVELYLLFNKKMPLYFDFIMVGFLLIAIVLYAFVTIRVIALSIKKIFISIVKWLKMKRNTVKIRKSRFAMTTNKFINIKRNR